MPIDVTAFPPESGGGFEPGLSAAEAIECTQPEQRHALDRPNGYNLYLVARLKDQAPHCRIEIQPLTGGSDYRARLAQGDVDIVIGNWTTPPGDLHLGALLDDESLAAVKDEAEKRGAQIWLEVVGKREGVSIVIEDGGVLGAVSEAAE